MTALLRGLLPATVAVAESTGHTGQACGGLLTAEEASVRTAGPQRRAEFAAGRQCARTALARLGIPAGPLLPGRAGDPQWPAGVTGSITHCCGYRACAVALAAHVGAIGIDAEPDAALPEGLICSIGSGAELAWIRRRTVRWPAVSRDRLLFSAKEAACKLWYPLTGQWPGFRGVVVFPVPDGSFSAHIAAASMTGRWAARDGLIVTAVTYAAVPE